MKNKFLKKLQLIKLELAKTKELYNTRIQMILREVGKTQQQVKAERAAQ